MVECQVGGEEHHEHQHVEALAHDGRHYLVFGGVAPLYGLLEAVEHAVGMRVYDVASVYDALPFHHHSAGGRYGAELLVELGLGALAVVEEVRLYVVVQVALLKLLPAGGQLLVEEYPFVCRRG